VISKATESHTQKVRHFATFRDISGKAPLRLHRPISDRRGKPPGVAVGFVYSFIGATPRSELSAAAA
jgi:hypothetical protein